MTATTYLKFIVSMTLAIFLSASSAFCADFTITDFHSDIKILADSSIDVTETIEVLFHRPRHGIIRDIPHKYIDELGNTLRTPLDVKSVTDSSGNKYKYAVRRKGNVIDIRIGEKGRYVEGKNIYVIRYIVENALLLHEKYDELYWNATGDQWKSSIERSSASVTLPSGSTTKSACYTGAHGSTESACEAKLAPQGAEFASNRPFGPGEGFTIALGFDKGIVTPLSSWDKFVIRLNLHENWVFGMPFISLIVIFIVWLSKGRDPEITNESITVMYAPPIHKGKPISPCHAGILFDESLDPRDISAAMLGLAVKGYIKIEDSRDTGGDAVFHKLKAADDTLWDFERALMDAIFAEGDKAGLSDLKGRFYIHMNMLKGMAYSDVVGMGYFGQNPESVRAYYVAGAVAAAIFTSLLALWIMPDNQIRAILGGCLTGLPVMLFAGIMPAKTKFGKKAYLDLIGFREFLSKAEKDRIERLNDKDLFNKFLPYAIALDVVENWAKAFQGIEQNPPDWYSSSQPMSMMLMPMMFARSMNGLTSGISDSLYYTPRGAGVGGGLSDSGFGGGGSSGGGFGGGGGGSW